MILGMENGRIPQELMDRFNSRIVKDSYLRTKKRFISVDEVLPEELIDEIDRKRIIRSRVATAPYREVCRYRVSGNRRLKTSNRAACYGVSGNRLFKTITDSHRSETKICRARYAVKEKS